MEMTGNKLYELIQLYGTRKAALEAEFQDSLMTFEGQAKREPLAVHDELFKTEMVITKLQLAQKIYNQTVGVRSGVSLEEAIKQQGVLKRAAKRWADLTAKTSSYDGYARPKDTEYAKSKVTPAEARVIAESFTKKLLALRAEIGDANGTKIAVDIDASWLQ
jgi:hypothetical protein